MQPYHNVTILHSSEYFTRSAEIQYEGKNPESFLKLKCSLLKPDDYKNVEKIN